MVSDKNAKESVNSYHTLKVCDCFVYSDNVI